MSTEELRRRLGPASGRPLSRYLGRPMKTEQFLTLALAITKAIADVHGRNLVHRNLMPENILVDPENLEITIEGLGPASKLLREAQEVRPAHLIEGSLPHLSPEQTGRMNCAVDNRSDLYSLGVIFYEMLTGHLPFEATDPLEWVHLHLARVPISPSAILRRVPEVVGQIVSKLLAKSPEDRYQTARALERDLRRALVEFKADGTVTPFRLAERDVSDQLQVPKALYGRHKEITELLDAFDRVTSTGASELVLVSGPPGIGKTALVQELHKPIVAKRSFCLTGKFEPLTRDTPYSVFVQAFRRLVLELLSQSQASIDEWRSRLVVALRGHGQLILDVIPEVALLMGNQPRVPELPVVEAQNRFQIAFRQFIGVFASAEHPLALFLDDLQWADPASLTLLDEIVTHPDIEHVFVAGTYRDGEVGDSHPLASIIDTARKTGARITEITLSRLSRDDVTSFVAATLHCGREAAGPLARLIHGRTDGNPFFVQQFLSALREQGLLTWDDRDWSWNWDLEKIRSQAYTDNVVEFMVSQLERLPMATRKALEDLASLGIRATIPTLTLVTGKREQELQEALWEAVRANLIVRTENAYQFLHDRIREAALALVPEAERPRAHLAIGRKLLANLEPSAVEERLFEIVTQFGRGLAEITEPDERDTIARLALRAGSKAKASVAFESARTYLGYARDLLPTHAWSTRYDLAFPIHLGLAECEYLVGDIGTADRIMEMVLASARSPLDRVATYQRRLQIHQMAGRNDEAIRAAYEGLRLFGLELPVDDEAILQKTREKVATVRKRLEHVNVPALVNLPISDDPQRIALVSLLVDFMPAAFISRPLLFPLITLEGISACLDDGNSSDSGVVYSGYAVVLASLLEDIPAAYQFSELALHVDGKFEGSRRTGMTLFVHGGFVNSWRRHLATSTAILERAFASALDVGDFVHAGHACSLITWNALESGAPLDQVVETASRYSAFAVQSHNESIVPKLRLLSHFAACLEGQTRGPTSFDDATFSEADYLEHFARSNNSLAQAYFYISKQIVHFLHAEFDEALLHAERAAVHLRGVMSTMLEATHYFYFGLTVAALYETASPERRRAFDGTLASIVAKLKLWAEHGSENHGNRYALLSAEIARLHGEDSEATRLYRDAVRSARDNGFVQNEALAYELGARFHASRGFDDFAETYLRSARARYARWGAKSKVAEIDRKQNSRTAALSSPAFDARDDHLDLLSVIKASQKISEELRVDRLAGQLLEVVLEQSGAHRACLLFARGESREMLVEGTATMDDEGVHSELLSARPSGLEGRVPESVVDYVQRTKLRVVIDDAAADAGQFAKDDYFVNTRVRSALALPILRESELTGILYLENDQVPRAFSRGQLTTLELLASQAAISLQNARLYGTVERENDRRKQAEEALRVSQEQLQLIIDSGPAVIFAKDLEGRYLFINRRFEELFDVKKDFLLGMTDDDILPHYVAEANRANDRAVLESGIPTEWEEKIPQKDGIHTYIALKFPLFTQRGEPYAVCGISTDITERKKAEAERERLLEKERSARLEAQKSVQIRDDFISIASHELRTPITPLKMYLQVLRRELLGTTRESFPKAASLVSALEKTDSELKRLERLIEDLLNVTRISAGSLELDLQELDLSALVKETVNRHEADATKAKCEVRTSLEPGVVGTWDHARLEQVVVNLLTNAIKYGAGKPIEVTVEKVDDHARFSVRDHGIGIAKEAQASIFERFVRVAPIQHYGGLGLGLYISHEFVAAHGGQITVESEPGRGSTFSVDLPLTPPSKSGAHSIANVTSS